MTGMKQRLAPVDALRGLVMIVMALDHVRDFVHRAAMTSTPTDLRVASAVLFFTRWVTHFCAPVFMLLAGLGAYFYERRGGRSKAHVSWFLVTRGLWLIVLELTVMQLAYNFDVSASYPVFLLVLWVLGACMIALAALVWLPIAVLTAVSVAVVVLHHLLDGSPLPLLHQVGAVPLAGGVFIAPYTLIPWFAVMALGYCMGPLFEIAPQQRRRWLVGIGAGAIVAFVVVRAINLYGDPVPWAGPRVALSFLNTTKYPPSLSFLLMTLGPALVLLAWFDRTAFGRTNPLIVFGRVPLFYFVLHFFAAHAIAVLLAVATYGSTAWSFMLQPVPSMGGPAAAFPAGFGWDLWVVYAVWITLVAALYPVCRWFSNVKEQRQAWWLSYL
jgi:uncharacterized membrane protein